MKKIIDTNLVKKMIGHTSNNPKAKEFYLLDHTDIIVTRIELYILTG